MQTISSHTSKTLLTSSDNAIFCNAPFCPQQFSTVSEFESHYNLLHRFFCSQCKKYLPTAHLLDLHLEENHDSFFELLAKKKESFRCFVEECQERFWTQSERRDHGIRTHKLPSNFRFATKEKKPEPPVTVDEKMEDDQEKITEKPRVAKVIAKSCVIKPITFGHNAPRSFYTSGGSSYAKALTKTEKKSKDSPADPLDNKMVVDLLESLPEVN